MSLQRPASRELGLHIAGAAVPATSGRTFETVNPATGELLATIGIASPADIDRAVAAAAGAQKVWIARSAAERGRVLRNAADLLRARND